MDKLKLQEELENHGLHSCLITHKGKRLFTYVKEGREEKKEVLNSVSKSVLGLLTGAAVDEGLLNTDMKIGELLHVHPSVKEKTVEDLLTMRSGYTDKDWEKVTETENWKETAAELEAKEKKMTYNNFDSYLLVLLLAEKTGRNPADYADEKLFKPLDIQDWEWDRSPEGLPIGGYGLRLRSEDLMKIASLVINEGKHSGMQLISSDWITRMIQPEVKNAVRGQGYGYHWWVTPDNPPVRYAAGREGKFLFTVPEKQLTAVFIGRLPRQDLLPFQLFIKYVYSAL